MRRTIVSRLGRSALGLAIFGGAALLAATPAAAISYDGLYVFGDSLVDAGNAYIGTSGATAQPSLGYFQGRFSNGPVFTDLISQQLTGSYTVPYLLGGNNYAVGGALAAGDRPLLGFTVPGLASQLTIYNTAAHHVVDPNGLYVINFGNNDVSAILAGTAGLDAVHAAAFTAAYTAAYVGNIVGAVTTLSAEGATQFLIGGVPNPDIPQGVALETALDASLSAFVPAPGTTLTRFDYFSFFNQLRSNPVAFGLPATIDLNPADACIPQQLAFGFPPDCTHFFSFDGIHPTAPVHVALALAIERQLGIATVPEPQSWALLITGFALTGVALRRRKSPAGSSETMRAGLPASG